MTVFRFLQQKGWCHPQRVKITGMFEQIVNVKIKKSAGASIDPWGTPQVTGRFKDRTLSSLINWSLEPR